MPVKKRERDKVMPGFLEELPFATKAMDCLRPALMTQRAQLHDEPIVLGYPLMVDVDDVMNLLGI